MTDTRTKILHTAEGLFAEKGFAATSLRQVIVKAGVNLAAIHYHFGTKEHLLDEIVQRGAEQVNRERIAMLDRLELNADGRPLSVEDIMLAFLMPAADAAASNPQFARVMGRLHSEGMMPEIAQKHFYPTAKRFIAALKRALPVLPEAEFVWRVHFMTGAMAHTMCTAPVMPAAPEDYHGRMRRLVRFLCAGFRAPAENNGGVQ